MIVKLLRNLPDEMENVYIYIAFHTFTHSYTSGSKLGHHAVCCPKRCLDQGRGGGGDRTVNPVISGQPALPFEPNQNVLLAQKCRFALTCRCFSQLLFGRRGCSGAKQFTKLSPSLFLVALSQHKLSVSKDCMNVQPTCTVWC